MEQSKTNKSTPPQRQRWSRLLVFAFFCLVTGGIFITYSSAGRMAGHGQPLLPLDDVYIHFQYAKQMAQGQPYVYNPGQPPTSGATSFLYPFVLAAGYVAGFQGLNLGVWAMIVGAFALLATMLAVYMLCRWWRVPTWLAIVITVAFVLTGSVSWHFMSGMETGLMILFTLLTLNMMVTRRLQGFVLVATLLAMTRPEGSMMAVIAVFAFAIRDRMWREGRKALLLLIPLLVVLVQPVVNGLVTGSANATGTQAKSLLAMVPQDWDVIIPRIVENFIRMWTEFFTGYGQERSLWYVPILIVPLGVLGLGRLLIQREHRWVGLMLVGWLLIVTAAISTLDTAFWHFKRYQIPLFALFFPLLAFMLSDFLSWLRSRENQTPVFQWVRYGVGAGMSLGIVFFVVMTAITFAQLFALNVNYVYQQPYQMALWLQANTPEDSVVAVHDVGMMRYVGERTTLDMVGLTTPGAAVYWRNGPGSVAEFLLNHKPDYIASYGKGHGFGLYMLAETSLYGTPLVEFPVDLVIWANVALAADFQGIYQPDYTGLMDDTANDPIVLDVADIDSEREFDYQWSGVLNGFPTEVHEQNLVDSSAVDQILLESQRLITGEESFVFSNIEPGQDLLLSTMVHPVTAGTFDVYVNDILIDEQVIFEQPGRWLTIQTLIPADNVRDSIAFRIVPHIENGFYRPAQHILTPSQPVTGCSVENGLALYQVGAFSLQDFVAGFKDGFLTVDLTWCSTGLSTGDFRFFVHLYDDVDQPPVAQMDQYPVYGTLPPGNWLPGTLHDTISVDIRTLEPGVYRLAIGFYNPQTNERLLPQSDVFEVKPDGRLFGNDVEIGDNDGG